MNLEEKRLKDYVEAARKLVADYDKANLKPKIRAIVIGLLDIVRVVEVEDPTQTIWHDLGNRKLERLNPFSIKIGEFELHFYLTDILKNAFVNPEETIYRYLTNYFLYDEKGFLRVKGK